VVKDQNRIHKQILVQSFYFIASHLVNIVLQSSLDHKYILHSMTVNFTRHYRGVIVMFTTYPTTGEVCYRSTMQIEDNQLICCS